MVLHFTGAGMIATRAAVGYMHQPIVNNGLIIADDVNSNGYRVRLECISNSTQSGVGIIIGPSGSQMKFVTSPFGRPGNIRVMDSGPLTSGNQTGIYTCSIPDDNGNTLDINVGLYPPGFSSE